MKKLLSLLLVFLMTFAFIACDRDNGSDDDEDEPLTMSQILENLDKAAIDYQKMDDDLILSGLEEQFAKDYELEVNVKSAAVVLSGLSIVEFSTSSEAKKVYNATKEDPDSKGMSVRLEGKIVLVAANDELIDVALGKGKVDEETSHKHETSTKDDETSTSTVVVPSKADVDKMLENIENAGFEVAFIHGSAEEKLNEILGSNTAENIYFYEGTLVEGDITVLEFKTSKDADAAYNVLSREGFICEKTMNVVAYADRETLVDFAINGPKEQEDLNGKNPETIYNDAYELISNLTKGKITTTQIIDMDMNAGGQTMTQSVVQTVVNSIDGNNFYNHIENQMNTIEAWYINGMYYQNNNGTKQKGELDIDAYYTVLGLDPDQKFLVGVSPDMLKDVKFESLADMYYLVFTIDGEQYTETMGNALGDMYAQYNAKIKISDVTYRVYFDANGNIQNMMADFSMDMTMTISGQNVTVYAEVDQNSTFENIGTEEVNAPSDASRYQSVVWQY